MSRRQQLQALREAETLLVERRQSLQRSGTARLADLRGVHPAVLVLGGFAAGVVAQCTGAWLFRSGMASSLLVTGLRLSRLAMGNVLSAAGRVEP